MKTTILLLLLALPQAPLWACSYADKTQQNEQELCGRRPGKTWSCEIHQCIDDQASHRLRQEYAQCNGVEDASERKLCFDQLAADYAVAEGIDLVDDPYSGLDNAQKAMLGLQVLHIALAYTVAKSSLTCKPMLSFIGAAGVGLFNEISNHFLITDTAEKLEKEYREIETLTNGRDQQLLSFEYLSAYHREAEKTAKRKKDQYLYLGAAYAQVIIFAGLELMDPPDECMLSLKEEKPSSPSPPTSSAWPERWRQLEDPLESYALAQEWTLYHQGERQGPSWREFQARQKKFEKLAPARSQLQILAQQLTIPAARAQEEGPSEEEQQQTERLRRQAEERARLDARQKELASRRLQEASQGEGGGLGGMFGQLSALAPTALTFLAGGGVDEAMRGALEQRSNEIGYKWLRSSWTIMGLAGISSGLAFTLYRHYDQLEDQAAEAAYEINRIAKDYIEIATHGCTSRDDPSNPLCFCFDSAGVFIEASKSMAVCLNYYNNHIRPQRGFAGTQGLNAQGCLNAQREYEPKCECLSSNSCFARGVPPGTSPLMKSTMEIGQQLLRGQDLSGRILPSELASNAIRSVRTAKEVTGRLNQKRLAAGLAPFKLLKRGANRQALNSMLNSPGMQSLIRQGTRQGPSPPRLARAQQNLRRVGYRPGSGLLNSTRPGGPSGLNVDFSKLQRSSSGEQSRVQNFADERPFKLGQADIHQETGRPLWELLSRRYRQSAFPVLLER